MAGKVATPQHYTTIYTLVHILEKLHLPNLQTKQPDEVLVVNECNQNQQAIYEDRTACGVKIMMIHL